MATSAVPANGFEPTAAILQQVFESGSRPWQDPDMTLVLSGRAETSTQSRILSYVRDDGPLSRMDLAARLNVSRTTIAAEVARLVELGLAQDGGPAESRGGRRSTLGDLHAGPRLASSGLGPPSMRGAVNDGPLG